jgi:hypothetical protein
MHPAARTTLSRIFGLLGCLALGMSVNGQDIDHAKWTAILQKYVTSQSRVNYARLKLDGTEDLDQYLNQLARPWPEAMDADATKAALIDVYNALTVRWIVSNFPVASIWRTQGPFRVARHKVDGTIESLDSIETRLRNMGDPWFVRPEAARLSGGRRTPRQR